MNSFQEMARKNHISIAGGELISDLIVKIFPFYYHPGWFLCGSSADSTRTLLLRLRQFIGKLHFITEQVEVEDNWSGTLFYLHRYLLAHDKAENFPPSL